MKLKNTTYYLNHITILLISILTGCGGGNSNSIIDTNNTSSLSTTSDSNFTFERLSMSTTLNGGGIKGPLAHAKVSIYQIDGNFPGFYDQSNPIVTSNTDANAAIQNLNIPNGTSLPFIIEVDGTNSTDLVTNQSPVINKLISVVTNDQLIKQTPIYATPLSTLTYLIAINTAISGSNHSFINQLTPADRLNLSVFDFGLNSEFNTFLTPPIIDNTVVTVEQQQQVANYRAANEALATIVHRATNSLRRAGISTNEDIILAQLAEDLAFDFSIDNKVLGVPVTHELDLNIIRANTLHLTIPKSQVRIRDISSLLETELQFGNSNSTFLIQNYIPPIGRASLNADIDQDDLESINNTPLTPSLTETQENAPELSNTAPSISSTNYLNQPLISSDFSKLRTNRPLTREKIAQAFGVRNASSQEKVLPRLSIVERRGTMWLQQVFTNDNGPQSFGLGNSGSQFLIPIPGASNEEIYVSFDIELMSDLILTKNGKLGPGLRGGPETTTGRNRANGYNGFSMRNASHHRLFGAPERQFPLDTATIYLYHAGQPNNNGDTIPFKINGSSITWDKGLPINVQMRLKLNTPETRQNSGDSKADGILQVWHNGALAIDRRDIRWRHDDAIHIDDFFYSAFYGGGDSSFATLKEETMWTTNYAISTKPLLYNPPR